ncbi:hypothetical protein MOKP125_52000 [Mycobacterium avium subsp. hominissuis]
MLVAQRHVVHGAAGQRVLELGEPDQRGFVPIGVQDVNPAVPDEDSGVVGLGQAVENLADQVGGGHLGPPRRRDELQPGADRVNAGLIEHRHVVGTFGGEQRTGVHRRGVQRVVVAREQIHRNSDGAHGFQ